MNEKLVNENLEKLERAKDEGLWVLNGNHNRRVQGLVTGIDTLRSKREDKQRAFSYINSIDRRQVTILEKIDFHTDLRKEKTSTTIAVPKSSGSYSASFYFKAAFDLLSADARNQGKQLWFITIQLNDDVSRQLYEDKSSCVGLKKILSYRLKKAVRGNVKGLMVLERSTNRDAILVDYNYCTEGYGVYESPLHAHVVVVATESEVNHLKSKHSPYSWRKYATPSNNAIQIKSGYEGYRYKYDKAVMVCGTKVVIPASIDKVVYDIDLGLFDYLSKHIGDEIVPGKQNFCAIGISRVMSFYCKRLFEIRLRLLTLYRHSKYKVEKGYDVPLDFAEYVEKLKRIKLWAYQGELGRVGKFC